MPNSRLEGRKIEQIKFRTIYNLNILGVYRQGQPFRGRLKAFQVSIGDVLLVHGENKTLFSIMNNLGCLPLRQQSLISGRRKYSLFSLIIFLVGIAISITGLLPIHISLGLSLLVLVLTNILPAKELYDSIEWPVIILLGSMIPLGDAMETTGATHSIVQLIMYYAQNIEVWQLLSIILIITMMLSDILNNAATAILMAPIASSIGLSMGYSADPFLMAVAIGSSCAFLTPIGHQNNALIMGPGGYNFKDYWKLGLPLEILIITIAIPALLHFWPPL
jgi:di/tricarboxylate transporter